MSVFKSKGKTVRYNKVNKAEEAGRETSGNRKSDVRLYTPTSSGDKVIGNLSLKQENAGMWESADKRYKDLMTKLVGPTPPEMVVVVSKESARRLSPSFTRA